MLRQIGRGSLPASFAKDEPFDFQLFLHRVFCRTQRVSWRAVINPIRQKLMAVLQVDFFFFFKISASLRRRLYLLVWLLDFALAGLLCRNSCLEVPVGSRDVAAAVSAKAKMLQIGCKGDVPLLSCHPLRRDVKTRTCHDASVDELVSSCSSSLSFELRQFVFAFPLGIHRVHGTNPSSRFFISPHVVVFICINVLKLFLSNIESVGNHLTCAMPNCIFIPGLLLIRAHFLFFARHQKPCWH